MTKTNGSATASWSKIDEMHDDRLRIVEFFYQSLSKGEETEFTVIKEYEG